MTSVIFVGPSLKADMISQYLDATILPPVRQGDVYRVARSGPSAIGIIDGFFEGVPSVWHKEILWAMEQGIPVFGSASMGALRAAELADFGMIGVGHIFDDYYNDRLQDDDEVAVLHSPAELGFQPLSEPMVSIRATVQVAQEAGILTPDTAAQVLQHAKALHYHHRIWSDILTALKALPGLREFEKWLPEGRIDAKALDAREMLKRMSEHLASDALPHSDPVRTEPTLVWKGLRARIDRGETTPDRAVIDEVRLNPDLYARLTERAVLTLLSRQEASRQGREPDRDALVRQMTDHRARAGLSRRTDLMTWLNENDLSSDGYEALLADSARIDATITALADMLDAPLISELRRTGQYTELRDRAARKAKVSASGPARVGVDRLQVLMWYFETRLDQEVPDDLESHAISLGLTDRDALYDLIEAEFLFCQKTGSPDGTTD